MSVDHQAPIACQGRNCGSTNGRDHSPECIVDAAEAQGWADAPEAIEARYRVFNDGKAWCAVGDDFVDLQQSIAGFGDNPFEALCSLVAKEAGAAQAADHQCCGQCK